MFRELGNPNTVLGMVVLASIVICFAIPAGADTPFLPETADSAGDVGRYVSLAVDGRGNPHMSYLTETGFDLMYAVKRGGGWMVETVDATSNSGFYSAIALDAQGNPHICYRHTGDDAYRYAVKTGGSWTIETTLSTGSELSLALDGQGRPHIAYQNGSNLEYAVRTTSGWVVDVVDTAGDAGRWASIALDALGNPHISYWNSTNQDLWYAVKSLGSWTLENVKSTGDVGRWTSLELDVQGNPHITHTDATNFSLLYTKKSFGLWSEEVVDFASSSLGWWTSLELDDQGNPHVSYVDNTNFPTGSIKYAKRGVSGWTKQWVDVAADVGDYSSLALDRQGNPHIGYYDETHKDLKYASAALHLTSPGGGETWPVGSLKTLTWCGLGEVSIHLSVDGGNSFDVLDSSISGGQDPMGGSYILRVPHRPSRFCVVKVQRDDPFSTALSDSFFTIEASVSLLTMMVAQATVGDGNVVSWSTDPGPEDLSGYRLEKRGGPGDWLQLVSLTKETSHRDASGVPGDRYRLFAVNGFGQELYLGEASDQRVPTYGGKLTAWPVPFRSGELNISFPASIGGAPVQTEVSVYDVAGRLIKTILTGTFTSAVGQTTWDGRDATGKLVAGGVYFLKVSSGPLQQTRKLVIVR